MTTIKSSKTEQNNLGLRIVRVEIPKLYKPLVKHLKNDNFNKADRETEKIMLKIAKCKSLDIDAINRFPEQDLRLIDDIWLYYSQGRFSLGIQARMKGNQNSLYFPRLWCLNAADSPQVILEVLSRRIKACGIEGYLPQFSFGVVKVNNRGNIINKKTHRAEYFREYLNDDITLDMIAIPGGSFIMGSPPEQKGSKDNERPQHQVTIKPFYLCKYPITQVQWRFVANLAQVKRNIDPDPSNFKGDNRPVERVSWYDAVEFCDRLSQFTGRQYRLPSEAEWEYACRAGTTTPFYFGDTITTKLANYDGFICADEPEGIHREETTPVGEFPPNAFGLYDMTGNVWEWCADDWQDNYQNAPRDGSAVVVTTHQKTTKVLRGGSWYLHPEFCRSSSREIGIAGHGRFVNFYEGFRVVCTVLWT